MPKPSTNARFLCTGGSKLNGAGCNWRGLEGVRIVSSRTPEHFGFPLQTGDPTTMRKTLFSVLPLVVLLAPSLAPANLFSFALFKRPAAKTAAAREASPEESAAASLRGRVEEAKLLLRSRPAPRTTEEVTLAV